MYRCAACQPEMIITMPLPTRQLSMLRTYPPFLYDFPQADTLPLLEIQGIRSLKGCV